MFKRFADLREPLVCYRAEQADVAVKTDVGGRSVTREVSLEVVPVYCAAVVGGGPCDAVRSDRFQVTASKSLAGTCGDSVSIKVSGLVVAQRSKGGQMYSGSAFARTPYGSWACTSWDLRPVRVMSRATLSQTA